MPSLVLAVPGDIDARTGGYGYDRRIADGLRRLGWTVTIVGLDASFPQPTPVARTQAADALAAIPDNQLVMVDGLALGAMPDEAGREQSRLRLVALVHHPLALETGLARDVAAWLAESERRALVSVRLAVVTSRATAAALRSYGVEPDRIAVVEPGTDRAPVARGSRGVGVRLLCVASVVPRKGHETLVAALAKLREGSWHLTCVGALDRDPDTVERLRSALRAAGLTDRVTFTSELDTPALAVEYDHADVFVLPTLHEGYGMAVAEALARGLPVVSTATGAIGDLLQDGAGLLVSPGDVDALAAALRTVIDSPDVRGRLAEGARRVRDRLPTWESAAGAMAAALARLDGDRPSLSGDAAAAPAHFSAEWLTLREPADAHARSENVTRAVLDSLPHDRPVDVLDLAAGAGSNVRYLMHYFRLPPHWLLVDHDAALLALACDRTPVADVTTGVVNLTRLEDHPTLFTGRDLVTASALLDLVSEDWLRTMLRSCRDAGASLLFALTYNGEIACSPTEPEDEMIRDLVNAHQRTDKGFGSALGPNAADRTVAILEEMGYDVRRDRSDWLLGPDAPELQELLIAGWADAASVMSPRAAHAIDAWRRQRLAHVHDRRSHLIVGHEDVAGIFTQTG